MRVAAVVVVVSAFAALASGSCYGGYSYNQGCLPMTQQKCCLLDQQYGCNFGYEPSRGNGQLGCPVCVCSPCPDIFCDYTCNSCYEPTAPNQCPCRCVPCTSGGRFWMALNGKAKKD